MNRIQYALRALAFGVPEPEPESSVFEPSTDEDVLIGIIPEHNPLETPHGKADTGEAAMSLVDPDVYGYLLLRVVRQPNGDGEVKLRAAMAPAFWPAVRETLLRLLVAYELHA